MSTSCKIEFPNGIGTYYIDASGYPDEIVPIIRSFIEDSQDNAEEKFKNPDEYWLEELQRIVQEVANAGYYSGVFDGEYRNEIVEFSYRVEEDGSIYFKSESHGNWKNVTNED